MYTRTFVARTLGVHPNTIARWEERGVTEPAQRDDAGAQISKMLITSAPPSPGPAEGPDVIVEDLIARLDGAADPGPGRWLARCPAHHDRHTGFCRFASWRMVGPWCTALQGVSADAVVAAVGMSLSDLISAATGFGECPWGVPRPAPAVARRRCVRATAFEALVAELPAMEAVARGGVLSAKDRDGVLWQRRLPQCGRAGVELCSDVGSLLSTQKRSCGARSVAAGAWNSSGGDVEPGEMER